MKKCYIVFSHHYEEDDGEQIYNVYLNRDDAEEVCKRKNVAEYEYSNYSYYIREYDLIENEETVK